MGAGLSAADAGRNPKADALATSELVLMKFRRLSEVFTFCRVIVG
jgi:hypothetical protein